MLRDSRYLLLDRKYSVAKVNRRRELLLVSFAIALYESSDRVIAAAA